jgi:hypothetical protein
MIPLELDLGGPTTPLDTASDNLGHLKISLDMRKNLGRDVD